MEECVAPGEEIGPRMLARAVWRELSRERSKKREKNLTEKRAGLSGVAQESAQRGGKFLGKKKRAKQPRPVSCDLAGSLGKVAFSFPPSPPPSKPAAAGAATIQAARTGAHMGRQASLVHAWQSGSEGREAPAKNTRRVMAGQGCDGGCSEVEIPARVREAEAWAEPERIPPLGESSEGRAPPEQLPIASPWIAAASGLLLIDT